MENGGLFHKWAYIFTSRKRSAFIGRILRKRNGGERKTSGTRQEKKLPEKQEMKLRKVSSEYPGPWSQWAWQENEEQNLSRKKEIQGPRKYNQQLSNRRLYTNKPQEIDCESRIPNLINKLTSWKLHAVHYEFLQCPRTGFFQ